MKNKYIGYVVGFASFLGLLFFLNLKSSFQTLEKIDWQPFFWGLLLMGASMALSYGRWMLVQFQTSPDRQEPLFPIFCSVNVIGMLTPGRSGAILACFSWKKIQGRVLAWSFFHRITEGTLTLLLAFLFLTSFSGTNTLSVKSLPVFIAFCASLLLFVLLIKKNWGMYFLDLMIKMTRRFSSLPVINKIFLFEDHLRKQLVLFYDTSVHFKNKKFIGLFVFMILISRAVNILANFYFAVSVGIILSARELLVLLAISWLSSFMSPTPNGIGLGDIPPSIYLSSLGHADRAGGFIILSRLVEFLNLAVWALLWMIYGIFRKPKSVLQEPEAV